jgi:cyclase
VSIRKRVIPVLLLRKGSLIKTFQFKKEKYVGDPINAVRIFNEKQCNELMLIDIDATRLRQEPNYEQIEKITSECFMPVTYGGGISNVNQIKKLLQCGVEKVLINAAALSSLEIIREGSKKFGSSSIIAGIDIKRNFWNKEGVYNYVTQKTLAVDPLLYAKQLTQAGAGELLLYDVDRDGMQVGYNLALLEKIASSVSVPVIICGGAHTIEDFKLAVKAGASAVAAGSYFVFNGPHQAVLINYLNNQELYYF